jgi:hypothetical protein
MKYYQRYINHHLTLGAAIKNQMKMWSNSNPLIIPTFLILGFFFAFTQTLVYTQTSDELLGQLGSLESLFQLGTFFLFPLCTSFLVSYLTANYKVVLSPSPLHIYDVIISQFIGQLLTSIAITLLLGFGMIFRLIQGFQTWEAYLFALGLYLLGLMIGVCLNLLLQKFKILFFLFLGFLYIIFLTELYRPIFEWVFQEFLTATFISLPISIIILIGYPILVRNTQTQNRQVSLPSSTHSPFLVFLVSQIRSEEFFTNYVLLSLSIISFIFLPGQRVIITYVIAISVLSNILYLTKYNQVFLPSLRSTPFGKRTLMLKDILIMGVIFGVIFLLFRENFQVFKAFLTIGCIMYIVTLMLKVKNEILLFLSVLYSAFIFIVYQLIKIFTSENIYGLVNFFLIILLITYYLYAWQIREDD